LLTAPAPAFGAAAPTLRLSHFGTHLLRGAENAFSPMFIKSPRVQRLLQGGCLERFYRFTFSNIQLLTLGAHKDPKTVDLIRRVSKQSNSLLTAYESYNVYTWARAQTCRPGDMAEVGVYAGCSAKMICEAKGDKNLRLFDTFEGLPNGSHADAKVYRPGQFAASLESAQAYLKPYKNVHFYKGRFPESAAGVPESQFCFAHFDVDLYESTLGCLQYFYPRMVAGGVMLSHDYSVLAGVKTAFDEFLADKPETVIELPSTQCLVIKH
jgi:hypothetical protein